ncbi:MAG: diguanylate cyclase [Phycisphaerae bacterium]|jgi:diguanylate cyclase (GGDEF)-like protein
MSAAPHWQSRTLRGAAAALVVVALAVCCSLRWFAVHNATALVFCALLVLGGAAAILARGIGPRPGLALGAGIGLAAALGLVVSAASGPLGNVLAFVGMATGVVGLLGYLAGGLRNEAVLTLDRPSPPPRPVEPPPLPPVPLLTRDPAQARRDDDPAAPTVLAEEMLGALIGDLFEWTDSEAGRACLTDVADMTEFAGFLRNALRVRLGAEGARLYRVSADGELLEPVCPDAGSREEWPSRRLGLIGHVVATGRVYVEGDDGQGELIAELAAGVDDEAADGPADAQRWAWLLPLRTDRRTCALITVDRVDSVRAGVASMAHAVRNELELFWAHVRGQRALARHGRLDAQSGLLNRTELLARLPEAVATALNEHQPLVMLVLAVEGLRGLDDNGRWVERDAAIRRISRTLRQKVRQDDIAGRFSDEHFVVILRQLDSALGTVVAEKLMEAVRTAVLDVPENVLPTVSMVCKSDNTPCVRVGLAGLTPSASTDDDVAETENGSAESPIGSKDAQLLLTRALGLLAYARQQRIDVATDLMKGLPPELMARKDPAD